MPIFFYTGSGTFSLLNFSDSGSDTIEKENNFQEREFPGPGRHTLTLQVLTTLQVHTTLQVLMTLQVITTLLVLTMLQVPTTLQILKY